MCMYMYVQVGNCVAKRNYRYFYLFLNTVLVMALYVMACNVAVIVIGKSKSIIICDLLWEKGPFGEPV